MYPPQYPSILVIGAGELGLAMLKALHAHPSTHDVSVLLRPSTVSSSSSTDPTKAELVSSIKSMNIKIVPGDYLVDSEEELTRIFSRFHTVLGCSGYSHGAAGLQVKIARAVLAGGVSRYVPWQFGVDYDVLGQGSSQDLFDEQLQVRALLRAQKTTSWLIISVGVFMSYLLQYVDFGVVDHEKRVVRALGSWDTQITVTDAADIGIVTVAILTDAPEIKDQVCFIAGETLAYGDLATKIDEVMGEPGYEKVCWDMNYLRQELEEDPENGLKKYRPVFASKEGIAWSQKESWNARKNIKMTTVTEYLAKNCRRVG